MRREKQIQELERKFDKDMEYAPLSIRSKVAMIKFWLKTIDLPEEDNFREAFERARNLYSEGNKVGVEVPKAIFEVQCYFYISLARIGVTAWFHVQFGSKTFSISRKDENWATKEEEGEGEGEEAE